MLRSSATKWTRHGSSGCAENMKFFAIFAAIIAVGAAYPASWTLQEIDTALHNPKTDPAIIPYLETALNEIMTALHAGINVESIVIPIPVDVAPVPEPADLTPVTSPLVQVIINVATEKQVINEPESSELIPSPVDIIENPQPIDTEPALVPEEPSAQAPFNPIDVIAVNPEPTDILDVANGNDILV